MTDEQMRADREQEIRDIEEEIEYQIMILRLVGVAAETSIKVVSRTIDRLTAALATAKQGMK